MLAVSPTELERQLRLYKGLVEVSALINGITESRELLPAILEVARRVMEVEAATLFLVNAEGDLELAIASGNESATLVGKKIVVPRGQGLSGWSLENAQPVLVEDAYADPRFFQPVDKITGFTTRSIMCVPLIRNQSKIGVLQILNPLHRKSFLAEDLEIFQAYGILAATAIDKLRAIERLQEQQRTAQEFVFAREIQISFLPQHLPHLAMMDFAADYRPALNVGGDFYDVIEVGPDEIFFVVGDVSGKGVPAALLMAQALSILRLILHPGVSPIAALARWNSMLNGHTIRGMFITALLGRLVPSTRHVELCSAGHCHPFLVSAAGESQEIEIAGSPPLGLLPELPPRSHVLTLEPGAWLVAFTDGLPESFDLHDVALDPAGIGRLLQDTFSTATEVVETLRRGEARHRGTMAPHDDLTVLVMGFQ